MKTAPKPASLRLRRSEAPGAGLCRIARGQIDAACRILEEKGDPHQAVHEARKAIKKLRAILRLAAPEWGRTRRKAEAEPLRAAARLLAPLRDARVRLQTFDTLLREAELTPEEFARTRAALEAASQRLARGAAGRRRKAVALLRAARTRIRRWQLGGMDRKSLAREIRRSYRKGRKALAAYRQTPSPASLHAWRKRMKTLFYHLRMVHPFLSKRTSKIIKTLEAMGEQAGNVHDLTVLREALTATPKGVQNALLIGEIESVLPASGGALLARGNAFYRERPRGFARRLERD
ncbi:MAG: CHAD domain-containing protein [Chthoniobacteraceae bacterium]|nr:CHAD domain-containing protein [Chthoniobacteraceae bacterium]